MHLIPLRALVVNDTNLARWALRQALVRAGFAVTVVATTEAAVAAMERFDELDVLVASMSLGSESVDRLNAEVSQRWPNALIILLATDVEPRRPAGSRAIVLETPFSVNDIVAAARRLGPPATVGPSEPLPAPLVLADDTSEK